MYPHSHYELAKARQADLLREARQERLAATVRDEDVGRPRLRFAGWTLLTRHTAARPAIKPA